MSGYTQILVFLLLVISTNSHALVYTKCAKERTVVDMIQSEHCGAPIIALIACPPEVNRLITDKATNALIQLSEDPLFADANFFLASVDEIVSNESFETRRKMLLGFLDIAENDFEAIGDLMGDDSRVNYIKTLSEKLELSKNQAARLDLEVKNALNGDLT